jgi:hypothetical protein
MDKIWGDSIKSRQNSPEQKELQKKLNELAELESQLAQKELELATNHAEFAAFERRYLQLVGVWYVELDEVKARIAEAKARLDPADRSVCEEADAAAERARASACEVESVDHNESVEKFAPSDELMKLFSEMVRMIHPDLATDDEERNRRYDFMLKLNLAYEQGDMLKMKKIRHQWSLKPEAVKNLSIGNELVRVIRQIAQLKERMEMIDDDFINLFRTDGYQLMRRVEITTNEGRDLLDEMSSDIINEIESLKAEGFDLFWELISQEQ